MLLIDIPELETFNQETQEFEITPGGVYRLEHSLQSITKWESKYKQAFLTSDPKDPDSLLDYISMMDLDGKLRVEQLTPQIVDEILEYMADPQTATTFNSSHEEAGSAKVVTSEVLYAQMAMTGIPFEADTWPINRLTTTLRVISAYNSPEKKMSRAEVYEQNRKLNRERLAAAKKAREEAQKK